jgi:hypothetical protein
MKPIHCRRPLAVAIDLSLQRRSPEIGSSEVGRRLSATWPSKTAKWECGDRSRRYERPQFGAFLQVLRRFPRTEWRNQNPMISPVLLNFPAPFTIEGIREISAFEMASSPAAKSGLPAGQPTLGPSLRCRPVVDFSIGAKQPPTDRFLDERQRVPCLTGVGFGGFSTELGCRQLILLGAYT